MSSRSQTNVVMQHVGSGNETSSFQGQTIWYDITNTSSMQRDMERQTGQNYFFLTAKITTIESILCGHRIDCPASALQSS